ncbi:methyltransferase domain-containing protein [Rhizobium oryzicola]|uniref:Methyltransferase type 11 domain-containing protein n=1 Tax=Rhizobium oryzicola TaxID=1232668 RepID=A0ABT8SZA7_9HYPH|nr:methyltransferase domain-containing protein [Rhizobium oryzicola]MDO1583753.1 hypothetical protein [Rhizobium oryzicola]
MSERVVAGSVGTDGEVLHGEGFHVVRKAVGQYLIVFRPPLVSIDSADLRACPNTGSVCTPAILSCDGLHALIEVRTDEGSLRDCAFSFVFSSQKFQIGDDIVLSGSGYHPEENDPSENAAPVISLAERLARGLTTDTVKGSEASEPLIVAQQEQIRRLQSMMHEVLEPLQIENRMLRKRLELLKQHLGQAQLAASDLVPDTHELPGAAMLAKLLETHEFDTVLDFGAGWQRRCDMLLASGLSVSTIVRPETPLADLSAELIVHTGTVHSSVLPKTFDCIIAINVLQQERDPQRFLRRLHDLLPERSILGLTVPALRHPMLQGELSIWNAGLVLYHLVLAGFDCSNVHCLTQEDEISVILEKNAIDPWGEDSPLPPLGSLRRHLPQALDFVHEPAWFNGEIPELNW